MARALALRGCVDRTRRALELARLRDARAGELRLDDLGFEAGDEIEDVVLLARRHLKVVEHGPRMVHEELPLALGDVQASVAGPHVAARVKRWTPCGGDEEVDDELSDPFENSPGSSPSSSP